MADYGAYAQGRIQLGRETTAGVAVSATTIWRGKAAQIADNRTRTVIEEEVGILVNTERSYDSAYEGGLSMPATEMTFEQLPHILEAGIQTATPSGAGPYIYTYTFPTGNTVNTIKTYTIEAHNTIVPDDAREMYYSFVKDFELSAEAGAAWMMSANWTGRTPTYVTPTAALSLPIVTTPGMLRMTKLYIDATGGTIGTTQVLGVLMGASFKVTTGLVPVPVGDGNLNYVALKFVRPEVTFSVTMELAGTAGVSRVATERAIAESDAVRLFRFRVDGASASQRCDINFAGKYSMPIGQYENTNGNTTVTFEGRAVYSSADSLFANIAVTNALSAIP
ncbi:MAG: hypothetical protein ACOYD4_06885 [Solirubrobacterales bacterium]